MKPFRNERLFIYLLSKSCTVVGKFQSEEMGLYFYFYNRYFFSNLKSWSLYSLNLIAIFLNF